MLTQRHAKQVAQQLHHLSVRAVCDQDDRQRETPYPGVTHTGERLDPRRRGWFGKRQVDGLARHLTLRAHKLTARAVPVSQASHALSARQCRDADSLAGGGAQRAGTGKGHGGIAGRDLVAKPDSVAKQPCPHDPSLTPAQAD